MVNSISYLVVQCQIELNKFRAWANLYASLSSIDLHRKRPPQTQNNCNNNNNIINSYSFFQILIIYLFTNFPGLVLLSYMDKLGVGPSV